MPAEIVQFLRETIGLDAGSIGRGVVERAILDRQTAAGAADAIAYLARLRSSKEELQALIEAVVVPETWFFRDPGAFDALSSVVRHGAVPMATEPLRLLSVPCSTGEEPYSMAMALLPSRWIGHPYRGKATDGHRGPQMDTNPAPPSPQ